MTPANGCRRTALPRLVVAVVLLPMLASATARGRGPGTAKPSTFEEGVGPILSAHCLKCHGAGRPKGGLDLRTPAGVLIASRRDTDEA